MKSPNVNFQSRTCRGRGRIIVAGHHRISVPRDIDHRATKDLGYPGLYVDWIVDRDLDRSNVTKQAAERIRKRLGSSKSLLLAFSVNAGLSKWMPWELGVVDGARQNCAILPVADVDGEAYERAEYLQLYPILERYEVSYSSERQLYIMENANRFVSLSDWISGDKPSYQSFSLR